MKKVFVLLTLILAVFILSKCTKDYVVVDAHDELTPYVIETPNRFPDMPLNPDNPLTEEGIALGRMLYYDSIVDKHSARSCASCHEQNSAFTTFSSNALPHINLGWNNKFLWNGEIEGTFEDIMHFEVADFFEANPAKLNQHDAYPALFKKVFNVDSITEKEMSYALAQFMRTQISSNSKWDKYLRSEIGLTPSELNGLGIYFSEKGDCFHCHGTQLFTDNDFHNTGLDGPVEDGRMKVTNNPLDKGKFKSPTLRNIEYTAPYMHDGRFKTLEEVIDFYSEGVVYNPTIDPLMKQVHQGGIRLKPQEKQDLIAFLKTLTDTDFLNNPALSNPFK